MAKDILVLRAFIIICSLLFCQSYGQEPACSRFAYEQSTLEKMIRTEIKVAEMEREMKKTAESITETERRVVQILNEITSQSAHTEEILNQKESYMKTLAENLSEFKNNTEGELRDLVTHQVVVFRANTIADKSLSTGQTLVFSKTIVNKGEGYDNRTGFFTATITGMYHLSVMLCVVGNTHIHFDIVLEDDILKSGLFYGATGQTCASADLGLVMKRDMKASIRCAHGYSHDILFENRHRMNIFSGYLVYGLPEQ